MEQCELTQATSEERLLFLLRDGVLGNRQQLVKSHVA
jgi:hypothetical protein